MGLKSNPDSPNTSGTEPAGSSPDTLSSGAETVQDLEKRALDVVGEYLKAKGCVVLVISFDRIQGPVGRSSNYELVVRFLGKPPQDPSQKHSHGGRLVE